MKRKSISDIEIESGSKSESGSDSESENGVNEISLFIFRRDLRLSDNTGLMRALSESEKVIPLFIFTPTQVSDSNKYKSSNAIQFMVESLYDLDSQISNISNGSSLWTVYGDELAIIKKIYSKIKFDALYLNEDYTPYSIQRDKKIKSYCLSTGIKFVSDTDILLTDTLDLRAKNGNIYKIFTQFYNASLSYDIRQPKRNTKSNFKKLPQIFSSWRIKKVDKYLLDKGFYDFNDKLAVRGGRKNGLKILAKLDKFKNYSKTRDKMWIPTTMLSAHNKFGTVSIREVYFSFKTKAKSKDLVKQLYWRDFYYYIGVHFKNDFYKHHHIVSESKNKVKWDNNMRFFRKWSQGKTGFPAVDAAINELNITGFMHNRGRLIVASFLTKDLLIDWKYGEEYFSKKLVDIDRAQNMGNWNWSSSFGLDSTPFLRILNPWSQSKKYDPECKYIKKWIPELEDIPSRDIHNWNKSHESHPDISYPAPIVDHDIQRKKFINYYNKNFK